MLAAGCDEPSATPPPPAPLAQPVPLEGSKVMAIAADFAIHKGITEACGGDEPDHLVPFIDQLRTLPADPDLIRSSELVASEMYDMARKEEPEHVCTPEMFEGISQRVANARLDWEAIREDL